MAQTLAPAPANALYFELGKARTSAALLAKQPGFVSAGEPASYQRTFAKAAQAQAKSN